MSISNFKSHLAKGPQMIVEDITPEKAAKYLASNTRNRKVKVKHIENLAKEMSKGEWQLNGDAIRFDCNGIIVDGQHRLNAIVKSGVTISSVVIRNLDPETFHTIDTNKVRGGADVLSIEGVGVGVSPIVLAGAIRLFVFSRHFSQDWNGLQGDNAKLTNNEILRINHEHPEIEASVAKTALGNRKICRKLMTPSGCAFLHCWLSSIDEDDAETFFDWVEYTENIPRNHPANMLKNKLSEISAGGQRGFTQKRMVYAIVFRAWNAIRDSEDMKLLKWSSTNRFPTPH